jgi:hypothetical protein
MQSLRFLDNASVGRAMSDILGRLVRHSAVRRSVAI